MKNNLLFVLFIALASCLAAQVPQAINYQAVARNAAGTPITNTTISVQFRILQGSSTGTSVYTETHAALTNNLGLFNLAIGKGTIPTGGLTFASINWSNFPYFLEVAIDPAGGSNYSTAGASEMLSVPYALRAQSDCNCTKIHDTDGDTYVETEPPTPSSYPPGQGHDADQIHMYLGGSPTTSGLPTVPTPTLVLRKNGQIPVLPLNPNPNIMLEIFDPSGGSNTFIGENTGEANTTNLAAPLKGSFNTAIGSFTFNNNTTGDLNTAIGARALSSNKTGAQNTAVGAESLKNNVSEVANTTTGSYSMYNVQGGANTANGYQSMFGANVMALNTGDYNTAMGQASLHEIRAGSYNTAAGNSALYSNNDGNNNTAIGTNALYYNTSRSNLVAVGDYALYNNGSGTPTGDQAKHNTAIGSQTLYTNTLGKNNTAIGYKALYSNLDNDNNTAVGFEALQDNTTAAANTAIGVWALHLNQTGERNTATGAFSLEKNQSGNENTAYGIFALQNNIVGNNNTATGARTLQVNTAYDNTATGASALEDNTTGNSNTATGASTLKNNVVGSANTANGFEAMGNNNGSENTAVGFRALITNVNGHSNTALGYGADVNAPNRINATSIGAGAIADNDNQIRLGNSAVKEVLPGSNCGGATPGVTLGSSAYKWKEVWACNGTIQTSDSRLKSNILNTKHGLADVLHLRPVQYFWNDNPDGNVMLGFIAQEVESIVPEAVVIPKSDNEYYAMKYDALIPVLTKAIQEQQAQIEALKAQNEQMNQQNQSLQTQLDALRADMQSIRAAIGQQPALNAGSGTK